MPDVRIELIEAALREHQELAERLTDQRLVEEVVSVARVLVEAFTSGGTLVVFGTGGSAADASHRP
ncbi:MAG: hypothetical protein ABJA93_07230 [Sporichthyaceae bacterium]